MSPSSPIAMTRAEGLGRLRCGLGCGVPWRGGLSRGCKVEMLSAFPEESIEKVKLGESDCKPKLKGQTVHVPSRASVQLRARLRCMVEDKIFRNGNRV